MFTRILIVLSVILPLMLVGCVSMVLPRVPDRVLGDEARPAINPDGALSLSEWEASRESLKARFEDEVYGTYPASVDAEILSHDVIDETAWDGRGRLEQYRVQMAGFETHIVTILPNQVEGPVPTIIMQLFCGNRTGVGGHEEISSPLSAYAPNCEPGFSSQIITMIFGEFIGGPPIADILDRGYALALVYPGDIVPDNVAAGVERLIQLIPGEESGAIAAWAWVYSRVVDVLDDDPRFDSERTAVWGHSRNGKSALLAGVYDERIDLVIAHQAGTGGTSLTRSDAGESVAQITASYPHWFNEAYARFAGNEADLSVDQHQLIALLAPRPLLIGGAWRDQWSDPQGSFRAALGANPVYALYGSQGLRQADLATFDPSADVALFMRPGLHGVNGHDWANFLTFLDAHFVTD